MSRVLIVKFGAIGDVTTVVLALHKERLKSLIFTNMIFP